MYQGSSCATCSGGNITSFSEWTFWSTMVVVARVLPAWSEVLRGELLMDVKVAFEVGEAFIESVHLHAVFDALLGIVFLLNFSHDGPAVDFQFCLSFIVMVVSLDFGIGSGVFEATGRFSQGMKGASLRLEQFHKPLWQGSGGLL